MPRFSRLELETQTTAAVQATTALLPGDRPWIDQADDQRRLGFFENALRLYSRALELDRTILAAWVGQVQMLIFLAEYTEAELWGAKAQDLFRSSASLMAARAHALCRNGKTKDAQAHCDAALQQRSDSQPKSWHLPASPAYPWIVRGELMLLRRDPLARHCFDKASLLDPDETIQLEIAAVYLHLNQPGPAVERCRLATAAAPGNAHAWFVQGRSELSANMPRPAAQSFRRCIELKPGHVEAIRHLENLDATSKGGSFLSRLFGLTRKH